MLASGTRVRGLKPGQSRWIFRASEKKVKESVPCPSFAACNLRELRCTSKIPCIVPSLASRGISCLCGAWRL